jgi:hypothetical protein
MAGGFGRAEVAEPAQGAHRPAPLPSLPHQEARRHGALEQGLGGVPPEGVAEHGVGAAHPRAGAVAGREQADRPAGPVHRHLPLGHELAGVVGRGGGVEGEAARGLGEGRAGLGPGEVEEGGAGEVAFAGHGITREVRGAGPVGPAGARGSGEGGRLRAPAPRGAPVPRPGHAVFPTRRERLWGGA